VYQQILTEKRLVGYKLHQRFHEIGSHAGLTELDQLLRTSGGPLLR